MKAVVNSNCVSSAADEAALIPSTLDIIQQNNVIAISESWEYGNSSYKNILYFMNTICDRFWDNRPKRGKQFFSVSRG